MKSFNEWLESKTALNEKVWFPRFHSNVFQMFISKYFTDTYSMKKMQELIDTAVFENDKDFSDTLVHPRAEGREHRDRVIQQANDALNKIKNSREFKTMDPHWQQEFLKDIEKARRENDHGEKRRKKAAENQRLRQEKEQAQQREKQRQEEERKRAQAERDRYDPLDAVRRHAANSGPWYNNFRPFTGDEPRRDDMLPPE